jgi:uncharacterized protein
VFIAYLNEEKGSNKIETIFSDAHLKTNHLFLHSVNLLEIYYYLFRKQGIKEANTILEFIRHLPLTIEYNFNEEQLKIAGRLKSNYKISLADSIAASLTIVKKAVLLTSDHHEFEILQKRREISIKWIR